VNRFDTHRFLSLAWSLGWIVVFFALLAINLIRVQSDAWWLRYFRTWFFVQLAVGFVATFWIATGGIRDMIGLFRTLTTLKRNDADDGRVVNHHNVGEPD
jgi:SSS family solute:Na+ symporter